MSNQIKLIAVIIGIIIPISSVFSQYTLTDADVVVTGGVIQSCSYDFSDPYIIIPNTLDGQTVIGIADKDAGNGVFQEKGILWVEFPNTLEHIGDYAFYGNLFEQNIEISDCPLDTIGSFAFANDGGDPYSSSQGIELNNVNSLKVIGEYAFQGNAGLSISSTSLDSIGPYALYETWASLNCPAMRYIGDYGCYMINLHSILQMPELEYIGDHAFTIQELFSNDDLDLRGLTKLTYIGNGVFDVEYLYEMRHMYLPSANIDGYNYRWTNGSGNSCIGGTRLILQEGDGLSATLEPVYSLTFNVGDGNQPVNGATVSILGNDVFHWETQGIAYTGSTNASGECVFNEILADEISFSITTDKYYDYNATVSVVDSDVEENVILNIIKYNVGFTITDGTNPIQGATVTLSGYDPVTTDAEGKAIVSEVVPGENITYTIEADGYNTGSGTVTVNDYDVDLNVTLELTKYTVTFSVTDGTNPIEGAVVTLSSSAKATDASGIVAFPEVAPEEGIAYTVIANGYENYAGTVSVVDQDVQIDINLTSTVGVSDFKHVSVRIYPNPTSDRLYVKFKNTDFESRSVKIIDLTGRTFLDKKIENQSSMIDISGSFHKGLYFIQILDAEGTTIHGQKIIIH